MKEISEFGRIQDLFVHLRGFEAKILDDPAVSLVCLINRNKSLPKKIVYLNLRIYKKIFSGFSPIASSQTISNMGSASLSVYTASFSVICNRENIFETKLKRPGI